MEAGGDIDFRAGDPPAAAAPRRLTTVVAADICGYSRLAEIDDDAAVRTVNIVRAAFEQVAARRRGRLFHSAGDGFLAEFPSASDGVLAALEFVADIKSRDGLSPISPGARVRAGVHAGDVVEQPDGDLLGHGVNVAARLQAEAAPNGVLVSLAAVNLVRNGIDASFSRRGPLALRNIDEPIVAFDVHSPHSDGVLRLPKLRMNNVRSALPLAAISLAFGVIISVITISNILRSQNLAAEKFRLAAVQNEELRSVIIRLEEQIALGDPTRADAVQLVAIAQAAESLARSEIPQKRIARDLIINGKLSEALSSLEEVYRRQSQAHPHSEEARLTLREAGPIAAQLDLQKAVAIYRKLYALTPDDPIALYQLGKLSARQNEYEKSSAYFRALEIKSEDDPAMRLKAKVGVIEAEIALSRLEGLEPLLQDALSMAKRLSLEEEEAEVLSALAKYWDFKSDMDKALAFQSRALIIENAIGRGERMLSGEKTYGAMLLEAGRYAEAEQTLKSALLRSRSLQDRSAEGSILLNLSYACLELNKPDEAFAFASSAYDIARESARPNLTAMSLEVLAISALKLGKRAAGCAFHLQALDAFETIALTQAIPRYVNHETETCESRVAAASR